MGLHANSAFLQASIAFATWSILAFLLLVLLDLTQWTHLDAVWRVLAFDLGKLKYFCYFGRVLLDRDELSRL